MTAPQSSADLAFTTTFEGDREVPRASRNPAYAAIASVEAPDDRTLTINWKQPYVDADRMFTLITGTRCPSKGISSRPYLRGQADGPAGPALDDVIRGPGPTR